MCDQVIYPLRMCDVDATQAKGKAGVSNWYKKEQRNIDFVPIYWIGQQPSNNVRLEGYVAFKRKIKIRI